MTRRKMSPRNPTATMPITMDMLMATAILPARSIAFPAEESFGASANGHGVGHPHTSTHAGH